MKTILLAALLLMTVFWGGAPRDYAILAALGIAVAMCAAYLRLLNKMLREMMPDSQSSPWSM